MRRTVISHFYNEAYLLPWWLKHHRQIFDHGVLIDYASTDDSVAICRDLVPGWEVVQSENKHFSALMCDFEVMKHEQRFAADWKIALNTTEFLVAPNLTALEQLLIKHDLTGIRMPGAIMVDTELDIEPRAALALVDQKYMGVWEKGFDFKAAKIPGLTFPTRNRLYHRYAIGAYQPGRHASHLPGLCDGSAEFGSIWWYAFSPWNDAFKNRKLGVGQRRDGFDKKHGFGAQHEATLIDLDLRWSMLFGSSKPLISADQATQQGR